MIRFMSSSTRSVKRTPRGDATYITLLTIALSARMRPIGAAVYLQETIEISPAQGKPARCTEQGYGCQLFAIRLLSNAGRNGTLGTNARLSARKIRAAGDAAGGPIPVAERLSPLGRSGIRRAPAHVQAPLS